MTQACAPFIRISENTSVSVCNTALTNNQTVVDIRRWISSGNGDPIPTVKGIQLTEQEFANLSTHAITILKQVYNLNAQIRDATADSINGRLLFAKNVLY